LFLNSVDHRVRQLYTKGLLGEVNGAILLHVHDRSRKGLRRGEVYVIHYFHRRFLFFWLKWFVPDLHVRGDYTWL
jgi:hypothetical protein